MEMASGVCGVRRGVRANRQTEEDSCFMSVRSAEALMSRAQCPTGSVQLGYFVVMFVSSQVKVVWTVRVSLSMCDLSSEIQHLQSDSAGPEWKHPGWFRTEAFVCWTEESKL